MCFGFTEALEAGVAAAVVDATAGTVGASAAAALGTVASLVTGAVATGIEAFVVVQIADCLLGPVGGEIVGGLFTLASFGSGAVSLAASAPGGAAAGALGADLPAGVQGGATDTLTSNIPTASAPVGSSTPISTLSSLSGGDFAQAHVEQLLDVAHDLPNMGDALGNMPGADLVNANWTTGGGAMPLSTWSQDAANAGFMSGQPVFSPIGPADDVPAFMPGNTAGFGGGGGGSSLAGVDVQLASDPTSGSTPIFGPEYSDAHPAEIYGPEQESEAFGTGPTQGRSVIGSYTTSGESVPVPGRVDAVEVPAGTEVFKFDDGSVALKGLDGDVDYFQAQPAPGPPPPASALAPPPANAPGVTLADDHISIPLSNGALENALPSVEGQGLGHVAQVGPSPLITPYAGPSPDQVNFMLGQPQGTPTPPIPPLPPVALVPPASPVLPAGHTALPSTRLPPPAPPKSFSVGFADRAVDDEIETVLRNYTPYALYKDVTEAPKTIQKIRTIARKNARTMPVPLAVAAAINQVFNPATAAINKTYAAIKEPNEGKAGGKTYDAMTAIMRLLFFLGAPFAEAPPDTGAPPSTPVGRRGQPLGVADGTNAPEAIGGRKYGGHAIDQMQSRGVPPSAVENTIKAGTPTADPIPGRLRYFDATNNLTVITESNGKVVTVITGKR